jgi:putative membrane protein
MDLTIFPTINAILNGTTAVLLVIGYILILNKKRSIHKKIMLTAFATSIAFLISYLYYHAHVGSIHFTGTGFIRPVYFAILISHTILAVVIVPMAIVTLTRALSSRFDKHRKLARLTLPLWLYVSVTGVIVYLMLYHF